MNVVLIMSDQHNPEFSGCYGGITRTPNFDRLAREGVRFEYAYCNYPLCAPSRASMFTGRYVHEIGFWDNATPYDGAFNNWARHFKRQNVYMASAGKLDFKVEVDLGIEEMMRVKLRHNIDVTGLFRESRVVCRGGKESYWDIKFRETDRIVDKNNKANNFDLDREVNDDAIDWLKNKRPDKPWLLGINYFNPHPKWNPRFDLYEYYINRIDLLPAKYSQNFETLNDVEQAMSIHSCGFGGTDTDVHKQHAAYHATIEELDSYIGEILGTLDEIGLREETLVIYTSDHGEMARAHGAWRKISIYEDSVRVPLIMRGPGIQKGAVVDDPVSLIDIYPTVSKALGVEKAYFARGCQLLDLAGGKKEIEKPPFVFIESNLYPRITGTFAIRYGEWKYVEYIDYEPMLFNLKKDPQELYNLATVQSDSEEIKKIMKEMRDMLYSVCCPEAMDKRAREDQKLHSIEMQRTGQLYEELQKRGFSEKDGQLVLIGEQTKN